MSRSHFTTDCHGENLACTLDDAASPVGLLIVSGGNETRAGAFAGQARLAARIAAAGYPVLRSDRRGVGDSTGDNLGFTGSAPDIAAAVRAFAAANPRLRRVVAFGNCDAASALMLGAGSGCDALVLANPWTFEGEAADDASAMPTAAIRARYAARLKDPREWKRLLTGGVDLRKLARGLKGALSKPAPPSSLAEDMRAGLARFAGPVRILLAGSDRTAQAFAAVWDKADPRLHRREGADHAFSAKADSDWLFTQLLAALDEQARELDVD
ncbi:hydrolase 1, exosortase A system-associated [Aurantiacibacter suaedae]|uniref:hydrolase 1, exosortase A system-associated n=1 Tax=Aurantiacibacter suaedae TaxID=2545755 RepID=UPI0010F6D869|nr:hydrolase 1, exosortase A system-associated [Aurantiacibacter suaedae]